MLENSPIFVNLVEHKFRLRIKDSCIYSLTSCYIRNICNNISNNENTYKTNSFVFDPGSISFIGEYQKECDQSK